jgi:hypothetical protein
MDFVGKNKSEVNAYPAVCGSIAKTTSKSGTNRRRIADVGLFPFGSWLHVVPAITFPHIVHRSSTVFSGWILEGG